MVAGDPHPWGDQTVALQHVDHTTILLVSPERGVEQEEEDEGEGVRESGRRRRRRRKGKMMKWGKKETKEEIKGRVVDNERLIMKNI